MNKTDEIRHQYLQLSRKLYEAMSMGLPETETEPLKKQVTELHQKIKEADNTDPASLILD